jgi:porin
MVRLAKWVRVGLCALGVGVGGAPALASEWPEVELTSCCEPSIEPYCSDTCGCGSACSSSSDCGYCLSLPMCDELTAKLTPMMMQMAESGFIYSPVLTQFYQGVADGGADTGFEYGGKVDQFFILDSGKLGLWQGTTMNMHVETRFGQDVNREAVGFAPVNVAMLYPNAGEHDTAITGLSFSQALDNDVQAVYGKFNALDLFYTLYPQTGRGVNGFMNASMVIPLSVARVAPLSFMGAGVQKFQGKQVQGALMVFDTQDITTTSGFDDMFANGANIMGYWRFFTDMGGLPGSHGFGGIWSTGEFVAFDPAGFVIVPDEGIVAVPQSGAYTLLYFYEQTLWMDHCQPKRNVGLLSQWGLADQATSPIGWSANVAIQAAGFSDARPHDAIGLGYFHTAISDDLQNLFSPVLTLQDVDGVEMYYTAALTKGLQLTGNFQVIEPADVTNDTAVVVGLRLSAGR